MTAKMDDTAETAGMDTRKAILTITMAMGIKVGAIRVAVQDITEEDTMMNRIPMITGVEAGTPAAEDMVGDMEIAVVGMVGVEDTEIAVAMEVVAMVEVEAMETAVVVAMEVEDTVEEVVVGTCIRPREELRHRFVDIS